MSFDGVTERSRPSPLLDLGCCLKDGWKVNPPPGFFPHPRDGRIPDYFWKTWLSTLPRKASKVKGIKTVPQTNTGGLVQKYQGQRVNPG